MNTQPMRRWVKVTTLAVWVGTALVIFVFTQIHPKTLASASLVVRRFSFKTDAKEILPRINARQLLISRVASLELRSPQGLSVTSDNSAWRKANFLMVQGSSLTSCSFENVTSSTLKLSGPSVITLIWPELKNSFSVATHGAAAGSLTSQLEAGFRCQNINVDGKPVQNLDVELSRSGGDSLDFTTSMDARFDFRDIESSALSDSQIQISDPLRISYNEPGGDHTKEKTVLLQPPPDQKNRITFDNVGKEMVVDNADLLVLVPDQSFYLRQFQVGDGIVLNLHGVVSDVKIGAAAKEMRSRMPSLLDHIDAKSRMLAAIPSIIALVLAILERIGVLPK